MRAHIPCRGQRKHVIDMHGLITSRQPELLTRIGIDQRTPAPRTMLAAHRFGAVDIPRQHVVARATPVPSSRGLRRIGPRLPEGARPGTLSPVPGNIGPVGDFVQRVDRAHDGGPARRARHRIFSGAVEHTGHSHGQGRSDRHGRPRHRTRETARVGHARVQRWHHEMSECTGTMVGGVQTARERGLHSV